MNPTVKQTFGELHDKTFKRFDVLTKLGYRIKYIWEEDYDKITRTMEKELKNTLRECSNSLNEF